MRLGLEPARCAWSRPDVGGGFGAKGARRRGRAGRLARARAPAARSAGPRRAARTWSRCSQGRAAGARRSSSAAAATGRIEALPLEHPPGRRRLPRHRRRSCPNLTALMASGVYRIPKIETDFTSGRHQHDADRPVPRRGPAGGQPDDRARRWTCSRRSSALDPAEVRAAQLHPERRVPVHHGLGRALRHRRLRRGARPARSRPPATTTCARSSGRRRDEVGHAARHRPQRLRRDHQRPRREGVRRGRDHRPTARRSSAPARCPTARATRRPSR